MQQLFLSAHFSYSALIEAMPGKQVKTKNIDLVQEEFNLQQYYTVALYKGGYLKFFTTSVKLTAAAIAGRIIVGVFAAFAFAKMKLRGSNLIFAIYILAVLLPFQVTLVPNCLIF